MNKCGSIQLDKWGVTFSTLARLWCFLTILSQCTALWRLVCFSREFSFSVFCPQRSVVQATSQPTKTEQGTQMSVTSLQPVHLTQEVISLSRTSLIFLLALTHKHTIKKIFILLHPTSHILLHAYRLSNIFVSNTWAFYSRCLNCSLSLGREMCNPAMFTSRVLKDSKCGRQRYRERNGRER